MHLGYIVFCGKSGEEYRFECRDFETRFRAIGAIYVVTRRRTEGAGYRRAHHETLYIGHAPSLASLVSAQSPFAAFAQHGANCLCVYAANTEERRIAIRDDLVAAHQPILNQSNGLAWLGGTGGEETSARRW
jgi:hypothetical protein